ncbi:L-rhamnose mutarotase [Saccharomonospora amisosensis]|uniref:L-rhamnose mutarotase n=1 Tax=Saccharomonospora amisosensis TaxID=1128677 RepID=A0A7X5UTC2_9PSEU|nr:L-rhamnose mutarotase [Saccharomonospora amisosensis]NIJ13364.1 L-rhamnose mutarotase [Saccharomonospora amisosensis]
MPQIVLHTVLKPGRELDYEALHATIPSDVAAALAEHGVRDWRIWRDGRHLFHLIDVADYRAMRAALRDHPGNVRWQATVGPLHEKADDYSGGDDGIALLWSLAEQLGLGRDQGE